MDGAKTEINIGTLFQQIQLGWMRNNGIFKSRPHQSHWKSQIKFSFLLQIFVEKFQTINLSSKSTKI